MGCTYSDNGNLVKVPLAPLLCRALFYVLIIDNRLEGPPDDGATVLAVQGCTMRKSQSNVPLSEQDLPCVPDDLCVKASQTLERLFLVIALVAPGHVEELHGLILVQGVRPVGPCSCGRPATIHDDTVIGRFIVWLGPNVL